jgi:hypothetical protein
MKKVLFAILITVLLAGCDEENGLVQLTPPKNGGDQLILNDSSLVSPVPAAQSKNVLIEDFTAVHCDNCPNAQHWSEVLVGQYPGRVSVIGVHCSNLAIPGAGFPDFRTPHGDDLIALLGTYPGLPIGDVNRKVFSGNASPLMTYPQWISNTPNELNLVPIANMSINSKSFDSVSKTLTLQVTVTFTQSSPNPYYFSAALIESGMIGRQQTADQATYPPDGVNDTFKFAHVLRKFMNPYNGLKITDAPVKGKSYTIKFLTSLDNAWVTNNCRIVAFVHKRSATNNEVEQVLETSIK